MKVFITHYFVTKLPENGYKQISYLTANEESYSKATFFLGFNGSKKLTEKELMLEMREGKISRLSKPYPLNNKVYLIIDHQGSIWATSDLLKISEKILVEKTKVPIISIPKQIFNRIEAKLPKPKRRIQLS
jgi:hypothetical protein